VVVETAAVVVVMAAAAAAVVAMVVKGASRSIGTSTAADIYAYLSVMPQSVCNIDISAEVGSIQQR
jgi:hypothetical protein